MRLNEKPITATHYPFYGYTNLAKVALICNYNCVGPKHDCWAFHYRKKTRAAERKKFYIKGQGDMYERIGD